MLHVTSAIYEGDYRLRLEFNDGTAGTVDLAGRLDGPVFKPLQDTKYFGEFTLTKSTLEWPNGADFAPEYLRDLALGGVPVSHPDG